MLIESTYKDDFANIFLLASRYSALYDMSDVLRLVASKTHQSLHASSCPGLAEVFLPLHHRRVWSHLSLLLR